MIPQLLKRQQNIFIQTQGGICASRMMAFRQKQAMNPNQTRGAAAALIMNLRQDQWNEFFSGYTTDKGLHEKGIIEIYSDYFAKFPDELNENILQELVDDLRKHWDGTTEAGLGATNQEAAQRGLDKTQANSLKAMFKRSRESIWSTGINRLITDLQISLKIENKHRQEIAQQKADQIRGNGSIEHSENKKFWDRWKYWIEIAAATIAVIIALIELPKIIYKHSPSSAAKEKLEGVVFDTADNAISGAVVTIDLLPGIAETTSTSGGFIFKKVPGQPGDRVRVFASRQGFKRRDQYFPLPGPARIIMEKQ